MPIIDLHCDTISEIHKKKLSLSSNNLAVDVNKLKEGNYMLQVFAIFVNTKKVMNPYKECIDIINTLFFELNNSKDINLVLSYEDIINNYKSNLISSLVAIEDAQVLMGRIENLYALYESNVRMICLNWNYPNCVGYPNYMKFLNDKSDSKTPNCELGLTEFGFQVVKEMNRLKMIIDVSHLSDKGFWDVISTTTKPIVASHSNSRYICNHVRNLSDEMIIALNKNKGVMGLNYYPEFLNDNYQQGISTIEELIKHIKHIKEIASIDVIALGSDFDGFSDEITLNNASMLNELISCMKTHGFHQDEIEKITYRNALRVLKSILS